MSSPQTGVILLQLGTPASPTPKGCRDFLREFLLDKQVIELPAPLRFLLVYGLILPFRSRKISKAYQKIWTENGSPLRYFSVELAKQIEKELSIPVRLGMRYQIPRIAEAFSELRDIQQLVVVPLFPQYAEATTGSAIAQLKLVLKAQSKNPSIRILPPFYKENFFVNAWVELIRAHSASSLSSPGDHLLFSYHGLPEKQNGSQDYRSQCEATTAAIANVLRLEPQQYSMSFQSRLGRQPWLNPYTEETLAKLARSGIERLAVISPSFICDGLETLEEIGIRGREIFIGAGGKEFQLLPSLNLSEPWINGLSEAIRVELKSFK